MIRHQHHKHPHPHPQCQLDDNENSRGAHAPVDSTLPLSSHRQKEHGRRKRYRVAMSWELPVVILFVGSMMLSSLQSGMSFPQWNSQRHKDASPRVVYLGQAHSLTTIHRERHLGWNSSHTGPKVASSDRHLRLDLQDQPSVDHHDSDDDSSTDLEDEAYYDEHRLIPDEEDTGCPLVADWQKPLTAPSTCNLQHEIGIQIGGPGLLHRIELIDSGGFKDVWRILEEDGTNLPVVLKTAVYHADFNGHYLNKYRRDALVSEAATASPYVLDIHGYCAHSSLVESAQGTLDHWLRTNKNEKGASSPASTPLQLLRVATMLAKGVADMQLFTSDGLPTFAHADIKVSQFLMMRDGRNPIFKINDFNRGHLLTYRTKNDSSSICPFAISSKHKGSTFRSPEEYVSKAEQTDKIDVFSFGSTLYYLLTLKNPHFELTFKKALRAIKDNAPLALPRNIVNSTDPSLRVLVSTMIKCRRFRREDRPNSQAVVKLLQSALQKIEKGCATSVLTKLECTV